MRKKNKDGEIDLFRAIVIAVLLIEIILLCVGFVGFIIALTIWLFT